MSTRPICVKWFTNRSRRISAGRGMTTNSAFADAVAAENELVRERVGVGPLQRYPTTRTSRRGRRNGPERYLHSWMTDGSKHSVKEFLFRDNQEIGDLVRRLIAPSARRLDVESPIVEARCCPTACGARNGARLGCHPRRPGARTVRSSRSESFRAKLRHVEDLVPARHAVLEPRQLPGSPASMPEQTSSSAARCIREGRRYSTCCCARDEAVRRARHL